MNTDTKITVDALQAAYSLQESMRERAEEVAECWVKAFMPEFSLAYRDIIDDISFEYSSVRVTMGSYSGNGNYDYSEFTIPYELIIRDDYKEQIDGKLAEKQAKENLAQKKKDLEAEEQNRLRQIDIERQRRAQYELLRAEYEPQTTAINSESNQ
jgi:hypothetical protein